MIPLQFDLSNLFYSLVILLAGIVNLIKDNWITILLIVLVYVCLYFSWKLRKI